MFAIGVEHGKRAGCETRCCSECVREPAITVPPLAALRPQSSCPSRRAFPATTAKGLRRSKPAGTADPSARTALHAPARARGIEVERLAFNGTVGDDFLRQGLQRGQVALRQPQLGHAACQMALCAVHLGQWRGQRSRAKTPQRPVGALPDRGESARGLVFEPAAIARLIRRFLCGE